MYNVFVYLLVFSCLFDVCLVSVIYEFYLLLFIAFVIIFFICVLCNVSKYNDVDMCFMMLTCHIMDSKARAVDAIERLLLHFFRIHIHTHILSIFHIHLS